MIAELVTYLKSKTELTDIVEKIIYRKPITDKQPDKYIYLTYRKTRLRNGYKFRIQINIFSNIASDLEILIDELECLFIGGSRVPQDLKQNVPKLWKTILVSIVPFPDELTATMDYEFYFNF